MDDSEIVVGDTVMLKSGGSQMTVGSLEKTSSGPYAFCYWFRDGDVKTGKFPVAILAKTDGQALYEVE